MLTTLSLVFGAVAAIQAPTIARATSIDCSASVARLLSSADADMRVVITFTGSQRALLPVDERLDPRFESTLFPISLNTFVLTLQVRRNQLTPTAAPIFAQQLCSTAVSNGARFNGAMSFKFESMTSGGRTLTRNRMIDAVMAEPMKN